MRLPWPRSLLPTRTSAGTGSPAGTSAATLPRSRRIDARRSAELSPTVRREGLDGAFLAYNTFMAGVVELLGLPVMLGIGINGHLAFNDPPADFDTEEPYIIVDLDEACRRQQLGGAPVPAPPGGQPLVELHRAHLLEQVDDRVAVRAQRQRRPRPGEVSRRADAVAEVALRAPVDPAAYGGHREVVKADDGGHRPVAALAGAKLDAVGLEPEVGHAPLFYSQRVAGPLHGISAPDRVSGTRRP